MHKKTLNIAATCVVLLLVAFAISHKNSADKKQLSNIDAEGGLINPNQSTGDAYRDQILQAVIDNNIKSFEDVSDSFKKKPTDTLSDTIAKNTFSQYIDYNTTETLDTDKIQAETIAALNEHPVEKSNVTAQDITLTNNSVSSLKDYVNTISIIQTELHNSIYKIRNKTDKSIYIKNLYKTAADIYKKVPVPESLVSEHLGIINGYTDYSTGFQLLELQQNDPAKALGGVQLAKEAETSLVESFSSIKKIVLLNNISYTPNDPAYIWLVDATATEAIKLN